MPPDRKRHCRNDGDRELAINCPSEPPKNAIGINTADSTIAIPTVRPEFATSIFPSLLLAGAYLHHHALDVLHHHYRIIDEQPMASTIPNIVSVLME